MTTPFRKRRQRSSRRVKKNDELEDIPVVQETDSKPNKSNLSVSFDKKSTCWKTNFKTEQIPNRNRYEDNSESDFKLSEQKWPSMTDKTDATKCKDTSEHEMRIIDKQTHTLETLYIPVTRRETHNNPRTKFKPYTGRTGFQLGDQRSVSSANRRHSREKNEQGAEENQTKIKNECLATKGARPKTTFYQPPGTNINKACFVPSLQDTSLNKSLTAQRKPRLLPEEHCANEGPIHRVNLRPTNNDRHMEMPESFVDGNVQRNLKQTHNRQMPSNIKVVDNRSSSKSESTQRKKQTQEPDIRIDARFLEDISSKEPSVIAITLSKSSSKLHEVIAETANDQRLLKLILHVLAKSFACRSIPDTIFDLLVILKKTKFFDILTLHLLDFSDDMPPVEKELWLLKLSDILSILWEIVITNPSLTENFNRMLTSIGRIVERLDCTPGSKEFDVYSKYIKIEEHKRNWLKQKERNKTMSSSYMTAPPDDFRTVHVFPQMSDIHGETDPFIRANISEGVYVDLDHYLDVQFRLLREDFIGPLREGIHELIRMRDKGQANENLQDVRIYKNVTIGPPKYSEEGTTYCLQFEITRQLERVNWKATKRLIYGSLVCLSFDNFKTFYFATVVDRDDEALNRGIFKVRFEHDRETVQSLFGRYYTMVETTAFFESYRHVLAGLQSFQTGDLPFEDHIVRCKVKVKAPVYLNESSVYDMYPLTGNTNITETDTERVSRARLHSQKDEKEAATKTLKIDVLERTCWPSPTELQLDQSQYDALYDALTKEFAIIQGPPGTGKTYIGLKIAKALLHNKAIWSVNADTGTKDERPILVVCYTNHALDQFLEGIIRFYKGEVLRIGGRSKNEALDSHNIRQYRRNFRYGNGLPAQLKQKRDQVTTDFKNVMDKIETNKKLLNICGTYVINEDSLKEHIGQILFDNLTHMSFYDNDRSKNIPVWLGLRTAKSKIIKTETEQSNIAEDDKNDKNDDENDGKNDDENKEDDENEEDDENDKNDEKDKDDENDKNDENDENNEDDEDDEDDENDENDPELEANLIQSQRYLDVNDDEFQYRGYSRRDHVVVEDAIAFAVEELGQKPEKMHAKIWEYQKRQNHEMKRFIDEQLFSTDVMTEEQSQEIENVWSLNGQERWRLYRLWLHKYCDGLRKEIDDLKDSIDNIAKRHRDILMEEDTEIMKKVTVIGMTTTGAAKYRNALQVVKPRIIIVEEAAEVLEAHIITTLSSGCEHLILIGDHKQLKPSPTVYKLAVKYNLDLSLFERMIKNGLIFNCLELQHRMRPEISQPLRYIYNNLRDHDDVKNYDDINGLHTNMFLINHKHHESGEDENRSHSNRFEAEFAVALYRHLILQGYNPSQITILATYSGQQFLLRRLLPRRDNTETQITVVDNYQGEENDIIILSLVRSNVQGVIGFLKTENRICVALSRAKKGFYIVGNFDMLAAKSDLWKTMVTDMTDQKMIGDGLPMYCQNHPDDEGITATSANDFNNAPEGGCRKKCEARLQCGHVCRMFCHILDKTHTVYQCRENCEEILCNLGHNCPKLCFEDCGKCLVPLEKTIPDCGHLQIVPCHVSPHEFRCLRECEEKLICGHDCTNLCGESHTSRCRVIVDKIWSCGHSRVVQCYEVDTAECLHPCSTELLCGHICNGTCGKCFNKRLHVPCGVNCKRILVCGHECTGKCDTCPPCRKPCENRCPHSKCKEPCGKPCTPCKMPCEWRCDHYRCTKRCSEPCDRPKCYKPCRKRLPCKHVCIGLCGEPCPPFCRICHRATVTTIMFGNEGRHNARFVHLQDCNHIVESRALDKYMNTSNGNRSEAAFIKLKACPYCSTPIRKNYRYGKQINDAINDIELVKKNIIGTVKQEYKRPVNMMFRSPYERRNMQMAIESLLSEQDEITKSNLRKMKEAVEGLLKSFQTRSVEPSTDEEEALFMFIKHMTKWCSFSRYIISEQEQSDFSNEMTRCRFFIKFKENEKAINKDKVTEEDLLRLELVRDTLTENVVFTSEMKLTVKEGINKLAALTKVEGLGITEDERIMIVKAINLTAGHWFKCPNNHIYAIGDCGGATEEGQCPECKARIGGKQHTLVKGNKLAREMDGAKYAAYSEEANNMDNFDLNNII